MRPFVAAAILAYALMPGVAAASPEGEVVNLVPPKQRTDCRVHSATGAEIARGARGFPGGAKRVARSFLREDVRFHEIE